MLVLVKDNIIMILDNLIQHLDHRLENVIKYLVIKSMTIFLDTKSYSTIGLAEIQDSIKVLCDKLSALLCANGCNLDLLDREFEALFEHVNLFLSQKESQTVWPHLFLSQHKLGVSNLLHIAELCLAIPLLNVESERLFLFMW